MQLAKVKKQFDEVISYSQNISEPKTDKLLKTWQEAKSYFINHLFNGELIYEYPHEVAFDLSSEIKSERYGSFLTYVYRMCLGDDIFKFLGNVSPNDFYNNTLSEDYTMLDGKVLPKGMKIIKAFKFFIKNDKKLLEDIQNKASEYIQENKITGKLCFSVHPLDYLSSSENTFHWRSCHSLDGEYRAGNLSYMVDKSTIVCYLKSEEETKINNFPDSVPWNNKKWRCLLHFDNGKEVIFAGRQYPFFSSGALDKIRDVLLGLYSVSGRWSHWHNDYLTKFEYNKHAEHDTVDIEDYTYCVINSNIYNRFKIIEDNEGSRQFNDLLYSTCYIPFYMFRKRWYGCQRDIRFSIGGSVPCLKCGEENITTGDTMMCKECECTYGNSNSDEYSCCDSCGCRYLHDEGYYIYGDEHVCPSCAKTQTFICENCGDRYMNYDKRYDKKLKKFVCIDCYQEEEE